ncbi:type IX secretion system membrane protein PorP/SprF [Cyclobacterium sp.]|uniref:PorP/SprF family type IX secretion system membrane protein n=1 Tax=Cyclobacterium sp. TaxID=1966343 RepID=UPI0019BFABD6|nr:type IX secretion system membrane protein PorP/SprF [Cyclobacterium sp.]MBD3628084.1 type IX secretion system membrane protein PorP/SprF [Cyclobacterium sp.]
MNFSYYTYIIAAIVGFFLFQKPSQGQQMPQYSQYVFNALHINPAYAGYKVDPFVQATYRSQFMNFPGSPNTISISADKGNLEETMGYGISITADELGPYSTQSILLTYAYKVRLTQDSYLGLGVSSGVSEHVLDAGKLQPDDPSDPGIPQGRINAFAPNLNAGVFYHTPNFFSGISAFNLVGQNSLKNSDLSLVTNNYHFYFQAGGLLPVRSGLAFKPSVLVREDLNGPSSYDINTMFLFNEQFWLGAAFRSSVMKGNMDFGDLPSSRTALVILFDLFVTEEVRFGYAYDFNLNSKNNYRNNSHEFSLGYYINNKWLKTPSQRAF